jgi:hypothetical protein
MDININGQSIATWDHVNLNGTNITSVNFNGSIVWQWSAVERNWWWCDTCWNKITTEVPSAMLPVIQASDGTYCNLSYVDSYRYRFNRNATRTFQVKIGNSSWYNITPSDTLVFRNAGDPWIEINGSVKYGGQDKPFLYMKST